MIVLDSETTNLLAPEAAPLDQQPYITEFAAIKLDSKTLKEVDRIEFLCRPKVPIPIEAIQITGITNELVSSAPPFAARVPALIEFFLGERTMVAHNMAYDRGVLYYELLRLSRVTAFPWPPEQICTVERSLSIRGHRMNLGDLHMELLGKPHKDAHRAMPDVEGLVNVVRAMRKKGLL